MQFTADKKLLMLKPCEICSSQLGSRKKFDEYELQKLADSISASGIIQPLTVRRRTDGMFEIISGERRLRAAAIAGLRKIPCYLQKTDDVTAAFYSVIENVQRCSLTFFEEAQTVSMLIEKFNLTRTEAAVRLGIAQSTLSNKLRILQLSPDIQERITASRLSERHARSLLKLPSDKREDILDKIIAEGLNIRQTEELIENTLNPADTKEEAAPIRKISIGDIRIFANSLFKLVDTMQNAGISAKTQKHETDKYIEYKVRISKASFQSGYQQLRIC